MPTSPPQRTGSATSAQSWRREFIAGAAGTAPWPTSVNTPSIIFSANWQVGAIYNAVVPVTLPSISAGSRTTITQNVTLTTLPSPITLLANQQATIFVSVALGSTGAGLAPGSLPIIGLPAVSVAYSIGSPGASLSAPGALVALVGPGSWNTPTAVIVLPLYAPVAFTGGIATLAVTAVLLGARVGV